MWDPAVSVTFVASNLAVFVTALVLAPDFAPRRDAASRWLVANLLVVLEVLVFVVGFGLVGQLRPTVMTVAPCALALVILVIRRARVRCAIRSAIEDLEALLHASSGRWVVSLAALLGGLLTLHVSKAFLLGTRFISDDLIYHAPAVGQWVQAGRLLLAPPDYHAYYPLTAELVSLWFVLPFHADGAASLSSLVWVFLGVTSIFSLSARMGGGRRAGLLGAVLLLSSKVVVEATSTFSSVDLAAASLLMAALAFLLPGRAGGAPTRADIAWGAAALGLSIGCKVSSAPAALVLLFVIWRTQDRLPRAPRVRRSFLFVLVVVLAGGGFYVRNWILTGNPLFPAAFGPFAGPFDPASQASTRLVSRLAGNVDPDVWRSVLAGAIDWPWPHAVIGVIGFLSMPLGWIVRRAVDQGRVRSELSTHALWATGVVLALTTSMAPFSGTTNSPHAPVQFFPRYFLGPFLIGLVLFAARLGRQRDATLALLGFALALGSWRLPSSAAIPVCAGAVGVLALRRLPRRTAASLVAASVPMALLATLVWYPRKQALTDAEIFESGTPERPIGRVWKVMNELEAGSRVAAFGPSAYQRYPLLGRRLQLEPVAVTEGGEIARALHESWQSQGPWWRLGMSTNADTALVPRLLENRVEFVLILRGADGAWPPQHRILEASASTKLDYSDDLAAIWRLDR